MNKKSIENVLHRKIDHWLSTIQDDVFREELRTNTIVTGGCITSMLLNEPVNDYDLYFTKKETAEKLANYYILRFLEEHKNFNKKISVSLKDYRNRFFEGVRIIVGSAGVAGDEEQIEEGSTEVSEKTYLDSEGINTKDQKKSKDEEKKKYRPKFLSSNAITLTDKIQCVIRFCGYPKKIHKNYDYIHCTNYYTHWNRQLIFRKEALESTLTKELIYVGSKYPLCSIIRARKFIKRGWFINAGQFIKMALQLQNFDLTDVNVLKDQLIGVDSLYFNRLISDIQKDLNKNPRLTISADYIIGLVDKIF